MTCDPQQRSRYRAYAWHALKQGLTRLIRQRRRTPVYLLIGSPQSGKKSLLRAMGAKPLDMDHLEAPWWHNDEAYFLVHRTDESPLLLKKSLSIILRWAKHWMPIHGVMVCLDIHKLYQSQGPQQTQSLANIHASLQAIEQPIKDCPITVVCTKSDLIAGFQHTFADPTLVDHNRCLGFTTQIHSFHDAIESFIKKLYDHAMIRAQQEDDPFDKKNILDFPRQIDAIKDAIQSIIQQMVSHTRLSLHRLCLTSVIQQQRPIDYLAKPIAQAYQVHATPHQPRESQTPYFVSNLMTHLRQQGEAYAKSTHALLLPWLGVMGLTLLGSLLIGYPMWQPRSHTSHMIAVSQPSVITPNTMQATLSKDLQEHSPNSLIDLVQAMQSHQLPKDRTIMESMLENIQTTLPKQLYALTTHLWRQTHPIITDEPNQLYEQSAFESWRRDMVPQALLLTRKLSQAYHHALLHDASHEIEEALLQTYLNHYAAYWSQQSEQLRLSPPNSINEAIAWLRNFSEHEGHWQQQLRLAYLQTQSTNNPLFNQMVSDHFQWLRQWEDHELPLMQKQSHELLTMLEEAQRSNHPTQDFFNLGRQTALNPEQSTIGQMIHQSELNQSRLPWLKDGTHHIWQLLLAKSADYINEAWADIYHQINPMIAHQFPFDPQANTDIPPEQFEALFKHNGLMDRFFDLYLLAFTDQDQNYWQWKSIFGEKIPLHQSQLEQFIRAHLIQDMFFTNDSNMGSTFSLTPMGLSDDIKTIRITLGEQSITYDHDAIPMMELQWPGEEPYGIRMQIEKQNGIEVSYNKPGFWGLFHLINQHAHYDMDRQQAKIAFTINGETIHLLLASKASPNPFIPDVLNRFHLEEKL